MAEKYFNLAEKAATTSTLKSKCFFGAAKCWQKRSTGSDDDNTAGLGHVEYSLTNPYFKILKEQYRSNEFTKEVYNTGSYFKDYIKKN